MYTSEQFKYICIANMAQRTQCNFKHQQVSWTFIEAFGFYKIATSISRLNRSAWTGTHSSNFHTRVSPASQSQSIRQNQGFCSRRIICLCYACLICSVARVLMQPSVNWSDSCSIYTACQPKTPSQGELQPFGTSIFQQPGGIERHRRDPDRRERAFYM